MVAVNQEQLVAPSPPPPAPETSELGLAEAYEEHFAFVWRSLRALGVPHAALDDATQDVFVIVQRRLGEFEERSSLKTWLFGIAYRVASNLRRSSRRHPTEPLPAHELASYRPGPHELTERTEAVAFVEQFLNGVDEAQRAAFTACVLEEMSTPEAAEALGVNVNTLASRLRAVRAKFMAAVAARGDER